MRLLLILLLSPVIIFAQDNAKPGILKPYSLDLYSGVMINGPLGLSYEEMKAAVPSSALLQKDLTGWNSYGGNSFMYYGIRINTAMGIRTGFVPYSNRKSSYLNFTTLYAGVYYSTESIG